MTQVIQYRYVRSLINIFIVEEAGGGQQQHCGGAQFDWPTVGTNEPVRPASQPASPPDLLNFESHRQPLNIIYFILQVFYNKKRLLHFR